MPVPDTRTEVLAHIVTHGGATVAALAGALQLADATVRRHLDRLEAHGLVTADTVRQRRGRPFRLYKATDAGVRSQRDHSAGLAARLIEQVERSSEGPQRVAEGLATQMAAEHRDDVPNDAPLEERVASTVAALRGEGILDGWERTASGFRLHSHGCPYRDAADASDCLCESDRLTIEKLIGVPVEQIGSLVHGDRACEYVVEAADIAGATTGSGKSNRAGKSKGETDKGDVARP